MRIVARRLSQNSRFVVLARFRWGVTRIFRFKANELNLRSDESPPMVRRNWRVLSSALLYIGSSVPMMVIESRAVAMAIGMSIGFIWLVAVSVLAWRSRARLINCGKCSRLLPISSTYVGPHVCSDCQPGDGVPLLSSEFENALESVTPGVGGLRRVHTTSWPWMNKVRLLALLLAMVHNAEEALSRDQIEPFFFIAFIGVWPTSLIAGNALRLSLSQRIGYEGSIVSALVKGPQSNVTTIRGEVPYQKIAVTMPLSGLLTVPAMCSLLIGCISLVQIAQKEENTGPKRDGPPASPPASKRVSLGPTAHKVRPSEVPRPPQEMREVLGDEDLAKSSPEQCVSRDGSQSAEGAERRKRRHRKTAPIFSMSSNLKVARAHMKLWINEESQPEGRESTATHGTHPVPSRLDAVDIEAWEGSGSLLDFARPDEIRGLQAAAPKDSNEALGDRLGTARTAQIIYVSPLVDAEAEHKHAQGVSSHAPPSLEEPSKEKAIHSEAVHFPTAYRVLRGKLVKRLNGIIFSWYYSGLPHVGAFLLTIQGPVHVMLSLSYYADELRDPIVLFVTAYTGVVQYLFLLLLFQSYRSVMMGFVENGLIMRLASTSLDFINNTAQRAWDGFAIPLPASSGADYSVLGQAKEDEAGVTLADHMFRVLIAWWDLRMFFVSEIVHVNYRRASGTFGGTLVIFVITTVNIVVAVLQQGLAAFGSLGTQVMLAISLLAAAITLFMMHLAVASWRLQQQHRIALWNSIFSIKHRAFLAVRLGGDGSPPTVYVEFQHGANLLPTRSPSRSAINTLGMQRIEEMVEDIRYEIKRDAPPSVLGIPIRPTFFRVMTSYLLSFIGVIGSQYFDKLKIKTK